MNETFVTRVASKADWMRGDLLSVFALV